MVRSSLLRGGRQQIYVLLFPCIFLVQKVLHVVNINNENWKPLTQKVQYNHHYRVGDLIKILDEVLDRIECPPNEER